MASSHFFRISPRLTRHVLLALAALPAAALAQVTWTGGGLDNSFADSANWLDGLPPANDGSAAVVFGPSLRTAPEFGSPWSLASLTFSDAAPDYTLSGGALTFDAGNAYRGAPIRHEGSGTQTITNNLELLGSVLVHSSGNLVLSGDVFAPDMGTGAAFHLDGAEGARITISGNITREGPSYNSAFFVGSDEGSGFTVELSGSNSFSGAVRVSGANTLRVTTLAALSAGDVALQSSASRLEIASDDEITLTQNVYGAGELHHTGGGTLTLEGERAYSGATHISGGGILRVSDDLSLGFGRSVILSNGSRAVFSESLLSVRVQASGSSVLEVRGEHGGPTGDGPDERSIFTGESRLVVKPAGEITGGNFDFSGSAQLVAEEGSFIRGGSFHLRDNATFTGSVAPNPPPPEDGGDKGDGEGFPFFFPDRGFTGSFHYYGDRELTFDGTARFGSGYLDLHDQIFADFVAADLLDGGFLGLFDASVAHISHAGALAGDASVYATDGASVHFFVSGALAGDLELSGEASAYLHAADALAGSGLLMSDRATLVLQGHAVTLSSLEMYPLEAEGLDGIPPTIVNNAPDAVTLTIDTTLGREGGTESYLGGVIADGEPGSGALSVTIRGFEEPVGYPGGVFIGAPQAYTGPTLVTGHVVFEVINDGVFYHGDLTNSALTAQNGAIIGGNGPYGSVALAGGAALSPGGYGIAAIDTFQATSVSVSGENLLVIDLLEVAGGAGLGWDTVAVSDTFTFSADGNDVFLVVLRAPEIDFDEMEALPVFDLATLQSFALITAAGGLFNFDPARVLLDSSAFDFAQGTAPGSWSLGATADTLTLHYTPGVIPEPSAAAGLAGLLALSAVALRRRPRR